MIYNIIGRRISTCIYLEANGFDFSGCKTIVIKFRSAERDILEFKACINSSFTKKKKRIDLTWPRLKTQISYNSVNSGEILLKLK
jgi:hypothetical protein